MPYEKKINQNNYKIKQINNKIIFIAANKKGYSKINILFSYKEELKKQMKL